MTGYFSVSILNPFQYDGSLNPVSLINSIRATVGPSLGIISNAASNRSFATAQSPPI